MLSIEPLTLAHPAVQAAKARWDEGKNYRHHAKNNLSFENWLEYFKADYVRFSEIAEETKLTGERVRQIYNAYFRCLFKGKSGTERRQFCTLENRLVKLRQSEVELFAHNPTINSVAEKARAAGCTVEVVPQLVDGRPDGTLCSTRLSINGHVTSLHHLEDAWFAKTTSRTYARGSVKSSGLCGVQACIFHTTLPGFPVRDYVFPDQMLEGIRLGRGVINFYFPMENLPVYRNSRPRIDYRKYEDAWHLLPPKQSAPVPNN